MTNSAAATVQHGWQGAWVPNVSFPQPKVAPWAGPFAQPQVPLGIPARFVALQAGAWFPG